MWTSVKNVMTAMARMLTNTRNSKDILLLYKESNKMHLFVCVYSKICTLHVSEGYTVHHQGFTYHILLSGYPSLSRDLVTSHFRVFFFFLLALKEDLPGYRFACDGDFKPTAITSSTQQRYTFCEYRTDKHTPPSDKNLNPQGDCVEK